MRALLRWMVFGLVAGFGWISLAPADDAPARPPRPDAAENLAAMRSVLENRVVVQDRSPSGIPYLAFFLEYWDKASCDKACRGFKDPLFVFDQLDEFATILVKLQDKPADTSAAVDSIFKTERLRWVDDVGRIEIPPPRADEGGPASRGVEPAIVHGGAKGLTGQGVIIAVIDSGIDFRHPDFVTPDGQSRLLAYWDTLLPPKAGQGQPGPREYFPGGPKIGTLYSRDDLNRYLKAGNSDDGPSDEGGHGTGCAGVAAGNGAAWKDAVAKNKDSELKFQDCRGVAPDAQIIAVRIGRDRALPNSWMLNAIVSWLDQFAGNRPLVISCSFGGQDGGHDASLIEERQLARRMPPTKAGRAICIAAGNEATERIHASDTISKDKPARFTWQSRSKKDSRGRFPEYMRVYIDGVGLNDVQMKFADGTEAKSLKPFVHNVSRARVQEIETAGSGSVTITTTSAQPVRADVYFSAGADKDGPMGELLNAINGRQIGTPATCLSAITVGSYDFNDMIFQPDSKWHVITAGRKKLERGQISDYSNAGGLRHTEDATQMKPELAAPGQWHVAPAAPVSIAKWTKRGFGFDFTSRYALFNGTSAATPYTAGVIALLLQKKPTLTADEFRALVGKYASRDSSTGTTPNAIWGYGKLDLAAVEKMIDAVR